MNKEFKPSKLPFIVIRMSVVIFMIIVAFLAYFAALFFITPPSFVFWGLAILVVSGSLFFYLQTLVIYKKRRYVFQDDRILQYSGGIFSDSQTELLVKNITNVRRVYPFIEYGIFKTGHIRIEAAGSRESEVHINSVDNVEELMDLTEGVMAGNGFNLSKEELKYRESPHALGAFFEVLKNFIVTAGVAIAVLANIVSETPAAMDFLAGNQALFTILSALIIIPLISWFVLMFLDLLKREYNIYSNIITYTEGFLNKHYAFVPFKNLSDSATTQTIIDRIFDLYDVKLSAQGSGHEILFKNLKRGEEISRTLDLLIDEHREKSSSVREEREERKIEATSFSEHETEFTHDLGINAARHYFSLVFYSPLLLFGLILPPILPVFIIIVAVNFIPLFLQVKFTRFYIKKKAMLSHYKFIASRNVEFNNEKITGLVIKRNFIDYWFNTATFRFYSIGSGANLDFVHVSYSDELAENIWAKLGVTPGQKIFNIDSRFSFSESLRASFFLVLAVIVASLVWLVYVGGYLVSQGYSFWGAAIPLVLLAFGWAIIYIYQVFYYNRSKLFFYEEVVYFQRGIFFKDFFYVRYDDIKDITTTKYPFSREGDIRFNIAGEKVVQTQQGRSVQSHNFTIKYVSDIPIQDELIDFILLRKPRAEEIKKYLDNPNKYPIQVLKKEVPSVKNPLFLAALVLTIPNLILLFPILIASQARNIFIAAMLFLAAVDMIVFGSVALYTRMKRYIIEDTRVVARWGVFYKKQTTVVFGKIDFLNSHKNILNKMFGNGDITVNTIGSSHPELRIKNINNYQNFYNELHKAYKNLDL